jgi:ribosomal protein S18 acetylase RimI-like enzyme
MPQKLILTENQLYCIITIMRDINLEIKPVEANQLLSAWDEMSLDKPAKELWPVAIEAGTNTVLIARLGGVAVGSVDIMWNGPIRADAAFRDVINGIYPNEKIPAAYGLNVLEDKKRRGIGTELMRGVEAEVFSRENIQDKIALTVRDNNQEALPLYDGLGYQRITLIKHSVPRWSEETKSWESEEVESWVMTKELR